MVYALKQLRPYIWGASYKVFMDHKPLTSLFTKEMNNTKIQRWQVLLAVYGAKIEYRKGKHNIRAGMLSRIKQRDEVASFDTADWVYGEKPPETELNEVLPIIYDDLDLNKMEEEQRAMDEWSEAAVPDSHYEVMRGNLYSLQKPHQYAARIP